MGIFATTTTVQLTVLGVFSFCLHHMVCGIIVPQPGMKPQPSVVKAPCPNHWAARKFPRSSC